MTALRWGAIALLVVAVCGEITWRLGLQDVVVVVEEGQDAIVLDCPYILEEDDKPGFYVKWMFERMEYPLYQWIPSGQIETPQITQWLDTIDVTYEASDEPLHKHRALRLRNPTLDHAGKYSCIASSHTSESTRTVHLVVYSLSTLNLTLSDADPDYGNKTVTCASGPTAPKPAVQIFLTPRGGQREEVPADTESNYFEFRYEVSADAWLTKEQWEDATVECVLSIPHTSVALEDSLSTFEEEEDDDEDHVAEGRVVAPSTGNGAQHPLAAGVATIVVALVVWGH